ncbi:hypothetical protein BG005_001286, partial [Podila minutissima]
PNELVLATQESITDGTLANLTADHLDGMAVMEVKVSGTNVHSLVRNSRRYLKSGTLYMTCMCNSATTIISNPQPMLPETVALRGANKPFPIRRNFTTSAILNHLPLSLTSKKSGYAVLSILYASTVAANYFASMSQNFFID